jgi:uncharacterized protein YgbK (DUF1537 family)
MIAVIADDITGAAEIAGIGYSYGMRVRLTRELTAGCTSRCDLLVVITNTRSATRAEAVAQSAEIGAKLSSLEVKDVFKKCDSVLRGHVAAELHALLDALGKDAALLLPANPSMGREIVDGRYMVNSRPITETPFALDPEFPATSDSVTQLLGEGEVISANSNLTVERGHIYIGNVSAEEILRIYSARIADNVLPAGGGSFFRAYLERKRRHRTPQAPFTGFVPQRLLMICGSTIRHESLLGELSASRIVVEEMPREVYCGDAASDEWIDQLEERYREDDKLAVRIDQPVASDPAYAVRLKGVMADAATRIVESDRVDNLIVEGGATAFSVIERLGWRNFEVVGQLSPGVITLRPQESESPLLFTLKPGSYQWPERLIT